MPATTYLATRVRALLLGNTQWTGRPTTLYLGLLSEAPTAAGTYTELVGLGYARRSMSSSDWHVYNGTVINKAINNWPAPATDDWASATHIGVFSAATNGNLLCWSSLTQAITITKLGTASLEAGAFSMTPGGPIGELAAHKLLRHLFLNAAWTWSYSAGGAANLFYLGIGTNSDNLQLYGEPLPLVGATATAYARGTIANTTAGWPATTSDPTKASNATAITNVPAATADWNQLSNMALLNGPIRTGSITYDQTGSSQTIVVTHASHGLAITHPLYASQSGTYARSGYDVTITTEQPHGYSVGQRVYCDFSAGTGGTAVDGCWKVTAATALTLTVTNSATGTITDGTVTISRPQHVDIFVTGASGLAVSRRYALCNLGDASNGVGVPGATTTGKFTLEAESTDDLTGGSGITCVYSPADVWLQTALTSAITINTGANPTAPANQLVFGVATA